MIAVLTGVMVGCAGTTEEAGGVSAADAIAAAKAANKRAKDADYEWRDTGKMIKKAEKALAAGNDAEAIKLANKARRQAENALKQKQAELDRLRRLGIINGGEAPPAAAAAGAGQYQVVRGDNLWDISGKSQIYGNPYQWPLIYKVNQGKIKDADLVYPGQVFDIEQNPSSADVDAAVRHAKTRGSWSLGVVEESDKAYLGK